MDAVVARSHGGLTLCPRLGNGPMVPLFDVVRPSSPLPIDWFAPELIRIFWRSSIAICSSFILEWDKAESLDVDEHEEEEVRCEKE